MRSVSKLLLGGAVRSVLSAAPRHKTTRRPQAILDTAPPTLTYPDFQTQVHAISQQFHDSVNAILTPRQLDLMKAMIGRLDSGTEARHAP